MNYFERLENLGDQLKISQKTDELKVVKEKLADPDIWQDEQLSRTMSQDLRRLEEELKEYTELRELFEMANEEERAGLLPKLEELERLAYFKGKHDTSSAILEIFSGAGGVDAQDWAGMLLKMYLKYCEQEKLSATMVDITTGTEAGIKNTSLEISGSYAFGKLKSESGVHRLVRLSPYNSKNLRQTSFALVEVIPEIKNDKEIIINDGDLKIDVFRASGHGGQSVNTTDSAVRLTHLPTGLTVSCQNQRSQLQNRETALRILKSRLAERMEKEHKQNIDDLRGELKSNEWGSQIRSYIIHPYKLVKDHRTGQETSNVDGVLNGNLGDFVEAYLKSAN